MKYRYKMIGMFDGTDGNSYDIQIPSPFLRDTEKEAMKDGRLGYRFLLVGTVPCLVCFTKEKFTKITHPDGYKGLKSWVEGDIVDVYDFNKFQIIGGKIRKLKDSSKEKTCIDEDDFEEVNKNFIDIFPNMESKKLYYVDSHGYEMSETEQSMISIYIPKTKDITNKILKEIIIFNEDNLLKEVNYKISLNDFEFCKNMSQEKYDKLEIDSKEHQAGNLLLIDNEYFILDGFGYCKVGIE